MGTKTNRPAEMPAGRPLCSECGTREVFSKGKFRDGRIRLSNLCNSCHRVKYNMGNFEYTKHKKLSCEYCGFVAIHRVQLDVHHLDGNNKNNDIDNLQTLCANCHRLVTELQRRDTNHEFQRRF